MAKIDKRLADAGYDLAEEIRSGLWNHIPDLQPAPSCMELIKELERRCPGYSTSDYQRALADGLFASR